MMRSLSFILYSALFWVLASSQTNNEDVCSIDTSGLTIDIVLTNPPALLSTACLTKAIIDEFIADKTHVANTIDCIIDVEVCKKPGYKIIADEIAKRIGPSTACRDCSSHLQALIRPTIRKLQQLHPALFRKGLAYLNP